MPIYQKEKKYAKVLGYEVGLHPVAWMLVSSASFAVMGAFVKALKRLPTYEIAFFRSFINFSILLPWLLSRPLPNWRTNAKPLLSRGVAGCVSMLLYFYAIQHMKLADAVILNYSSPLPTLILSALLLNEKLSAKSVVFILVAFTGVGLIVKPDFAFWNAKISGDPAVFWAPIAGFLSMFVASIAYVSIKMATRALPPRFIVITFASISSALTLVPTLLTFAMPSKHEWVLIFFCGTLATLAQASMTKAYSGLPASIASPLSLSTAVFSALLGAFFWNETPDFFSGVGTLLIIIGLIGAYALRPHHAKNIGNLGG